MNIQVLCPEGHPVVIHSGKLGGDVACPRCLIRFFAEADAESRHHARPEKGKARPARDDDDDDDEEEDRPQKKSPPKKKDDAKKEKKADETERPKLKKPVRKKRDEEDEEDEDEDEQDEEDEEESEEEAIEIEWTPRKRQLNVARNALVGYITGIWAMVGSTLLTAVIVGLGLMVQFGVPMIEFMVWAVIGILAGTAIAYIAFLVAWIMCFWAPTKAELRSSLILAIIFMATPALLLVISAIMSAASFFRTPEVEKSFGMLIGSACGISLFISLLFGLSALGKLCLFMGDKKLSAQPITLGFGVIGFNVLIGALIGVHSTLLKMYVEGKNDIYNYLAFAVVGLSVGALFFLLRTLHGLVGVCQQVRKYIQTYIETQ